jgi:beta-galactosidase
LFDLVDYLWSVPVHSEVMNRWRPTSLAFGGDYNPEQWDQPTQHEDIELMVQSGVNLVTLGVFSWATLEPTPGVFEFGWLDDSLQRLQQAGVNVDLATATASPPAWLADQHPEILPVTAEGTRLWPGGRQHYCPSSPVFRDYSLRLCREMAIRYGNHPAVVMWHVSNELGCHNALCYCDVSAAAFRDWLAKKYGRDIDALNQAWGTKFWSQSYSTFEEILPPRVAPNFPNPTHQLDFRRFSSDQLLANYKAEREVLREHSSMPVTTNFMVMSHIKEMDYFSWAPELDLIAADPEPYRELAFCADLTRGLSHGQPWLLMETSTSAVNWQPRNVAKQPGELLRNSMQHIARGADGVLFFQWRASKAGAEKFHAGLVPHAGTNSRLWREVCELGGVLGQLTEVVGSTSNNDVAICFDWQAWWGCELDSHPSSDVKYLDVAQQLHRALTDFGVGVDFVHPEGDLGAYRLILVPTLYLVSDVGAANIASAAARGATVLVTYFSGIVDPHDHIRLGGYPGAFRDLLGVRVEEFLPLRAGATVTLSDGTGASVWSEHTEATQAQIVTYFQDGPAQGLPSLTRHTIGDNTIEGKTQGTAWYLATKLDQGGMAKLVNQLLDEAGVAPIAAGRPGVELTRRVNGPTEWIFVVNHTSEPYPADLSGFDVLGGQTVAELIVPPGGARVLRRVVRPVLGGAS